ncbi:MAG: NTP transferase domain-containing protein [Muribaculaceae bacterium]|nr:NTP transferase domain-containing protein [Muribaculaceae bacterium]
MNTNEFPRLLERHSVSTKANVLEAMKKINSLSGESMTLFALDPEGILRGTVTDGDIRRALVERGSLDLTVEQVMHTHFLVAHPGDDLSEIMAKGRRRHIDLLPLVEEGRIVELLDLRKIKSFIPVEAVLMAGGRGERLRPLTDTIPKPLLKVGEKPIIEYNLEELEACGVKRIHVTVNYLADMIEEYFRHRSGMAKIECVREPKRLGTIGSMALIDDFRSEDILLMNSDLLMDIDFQAIYLEHRHRDADITMAAVPYNVSVPFAIMKMKNDCVETIEEKPTYNYFANGGVYMIKRTLIERIPREEYMDAPDFISSVIEAGGKVCCHHLEGSWIDIGSPDDYRLACELMARRNKSII